jgi:hypothetical protein
MRPYRSFRHAVEHFVTVTVPRVRSAAVALVLVACIVAAFIASPAFGAASLAMTVAVALIMLGCVAAGYWSVSLGVTGDTVVLRHWLRRRRFDRQSCVMEHIVIANAHARRQVLVISDASGAGSATVETQTWPRDGVIRMAAALGQGTPDLRLVDASDHARLPAQLLKPVNWTKVITLSLVLSGVGLAVALLLTRFATHPAP